MMFTAARYDGLNAKLHAMRGRLLRREDYETLAQHKTVEGFGGKLREFPAYEKVLADAPDAALRRGFVERKLALSLADDFRRISSFAGEHSLRAYLDAHYLRNEIEYLKLLLCAMYDRRRIPYTLPELNELFARKHRLNIGALVGANTLEAFVANLQGSEFHAVLAKHLGASPPSLFDLEMSLDLHYFMQRETARRKWLDKPNQKAAAYLNGTEIDLQNILWTYRLKTYYEVSEARIYTCLIPQRLRLQKAALARMVEARTPEALREEILATPYAEALAGGDAIDTGCRLTMRRAYRKACKQFPGTIAPALSYLFDKENELRNTVSLLESIRYGLFRNEALSLIL